MGKSRHEPTYIYLRYRAQVRQGCEYLHALHLELGAGRTWGADGKAVGEDHA